MTAICIPLQYNNPFFLPTDRGVSDDAQTYKMLVEKMLGDCSHSAVINADESLQDLYTIWEECASENWDGYGAMPIDHRSYENALHFAMSLPLNIPSPEVDVTPNGKVLFTWSEGKRKIFSVIIGNMNELSYAGLYGATQTYGVEYFSDGIPITIINNIEHVSRCSPWNGSHTTMVSGSCGIIRLCG